jgi:RimJ/RimL family protein N-acetyltransferase
MLRLRPRRPPRVVARGRLCTVREFERADVDRWLDWPRHQDPLFHVFNPPPMSTRQRDSYFESRRGASDVRLFAVDDLQGELIGRLNLREIDWFARTAVVGISFRPDRLGQGFGTDSLRAFLYYYFTTLQMMALFLDVAAHNVRARRCYERCGFRHVGDHWGESLPDTAGIFRHPRNAEMRPFFRREGALIRALFLDMVIRPADFDRARREAADSAAGADTSESRG